MARGVLPLPALAVFAAYPDDEAPLHLTLRSRVEIDRAGGEWREATADEPFSPSDAMAYYKDAPQRRSILAIPPAAPPVPREIADPGLPIDDSDGGCDTPNNPPARNGAGDRTHREILGAHGDFG